MSSTNSCASTVLTVAFAFQRRAVPAERIRFVADFAADQALRLLLIPAAGGLGRHNFTDAPVAQQLFGDRPGIALRRPNLSRRDAGQHHQRQQRLLQVFNRIVFSFVSVPSLPSRSTAIIISPPIRRQNNPHRARRRPLIANRYES